MKHYPYKIKVGNKHYQILLSNLEREFGMCSDCPAQILLDVKLNKDEMSSTFLHELTHVFDFENDIKLTEKQVLKLEKAWYKFLRDNKQFFLEFLKNV